jgi:hypothetical protein
MAMLCGLYQPGFICYFFEAHAGEKLIPLAAFEVRNLAREILLQI